ncbi:tRNA (guanosine(37)-N1)-methyltransferase TrmD [bacterium]|nr:tRNA (guanosine(37)-N1)-methyltransferase TrmD [bacterium]
MRIDILTLFPEMFDGPLSESILRQAREKGILDVRLVNIRDFALDKHRTADDYQYGGGSGMVMKPDPVLGALESVTVEGSMESTAVVLLSARGRLFDQATALDLSCRSRVVLICGRYKGIDERVLDAVTDEISIGDYILTGGELGAMIMVDAVTRLIPGVLGDIESAETDSFYEGILGPPVYTRPEEFHGMRVPEVLLSGNHERIRRWRREQALRVTLERRPDLLEKADLTDEDREILREMKAEQ